MMKVGDAIKQTRSPLFKLGQSTPDNIAAIQGKGLADLLSYRAPTDRERNDYQSAGVLMRELADTVVQWRSAVPENTQPAVLAILYGGTHIHVHCLQDVGFNSIRIEGTLQGGGHCVMLAHQATVQLLCYIQEITTEEPKRKIGFVIGDEKIDV